MKQKVITLLKSVIAVALLSFLFLQVDWASFLLVLQKVKITFLVIAALLAYAGVYVSVLKWDIFLKNYKVNIRKLKLYSLYSISAFFSNFLPTSIGGDVYRVIRITKKTNHSKVDITSSVILERGFGFLTLFLINFFLIPMFYSVIFSSKAFIIVEMVILAFFLCIVIFLVKHNFFIALKEKFVKKDIKLLNKFIDLVKSVLAVKSKKTIIYGFLYSFLFSLIVGLGRFFLLYSFGLTINFWYILLATSIIQIFGLIPVSLNSIGVTEGVSVFLFSFIGVPVEVSLAAALVARVSSLVTSSFGGLFYFLDKKIKY